MEYDESKVYTVKDADKLKIGSRVIVANNVSNLKYEVEREIYITTLTKVLPEDDMLRFRTGNDLDSALAYLVSEPEEKKLKVSDLKIGDIVRHKKNKCEFLIIGIHYEDNTVLFGDVWTDDEELADWEKVEEINNGGKNA